MRVLAMACGRTEWPGDILVAAGSHLARFRWRGSPGNGAVQRRCAATVLSGASELLEVNCGDGQLLRVRISAREPLFGEHEFVFSGADAIRVQE